MLLPDDQKCCGIVFIKKKKRERETEVKAGKCKEAQVKMPPKKKSYLQFASQRIPLNASILLHHVNIRFTK